MTREEFHEKCKTLQGHVYLPGNWQHEAVVVDKAFIVYWETGGVAGGSCWDDSDPQPYTSDEPEAEFTALDTILEEFDVSFMTFRRIAEKVDRRNATVSEYYGNCTEYGVKVLLFDDVYDILAEKGYV